MQRSSLLCAAALALAACNEAARTPVAPDHAIDAQFGVVSTPNKQDWKQCQNGKDYSSVCVWTTGNLNQTHNAYREGDFVPKALRISTINNDQPFEVVMTYGLMKGGKTTHDFIGKWNEHMVNANPCVEESYSGRGTQSNPLTTLCTGAAPSNLIAISAVSNSMAALSQAAANAVCAAPQQAAMAAAIAAVGASKLVIEGVNVASINVTDIAFTGCPSSGDAEAKLTMTVTPNAAGVASKNLLLLFGAHVGRSLDWPNGGAGGVEGSPYHLGLVSVDDRSAGSMDLQMAANVLAASPALEITKTAGDATVSAGDSVTFSITVSNNGTGTAQGVTLNDPLPANPGMSWSIIAQPSGNPCVINGSAPSQTLACDFGDLASSATRSVTVKSETTRESCGVLPNTAVASATNHDPVQANASVTVDCPSLQITKTAANPTVSAGDSIKFTITVSSNGPGTAYDVTLLDPFLPSPGLSWVIKSQPLGDPCVINTAGPTQALFCDFGDLATSQSRSVTVATRTSIADCAVYANVASAAATNHLPVGANAQTTVQCPNLVVAKSPDAASGAAGAPISFTMSINNTGAGTASNVLLTDTLPVGPGIAWAIDPAVAGCAITPGALGETILACSFGTMVAGAVRSVTVVSPTTIESCAVYNNQVHVESTAGATGTPGSGGGGFDTGSVTVTNCTVPDVSETAFAFGQTPLNALPGINGKSWGWQITFNTAAGAQVYNIYAGAGKNNASKSTLVGTLTLDYVSGKLVATYQLNAPYTMDAAHLYVGTTPINTASPGQFGNTQTFSPNAATHTFEISAPAGTLYVVAHAVVFGS